MDTSVRSIGRLRYQLIWSSSGSWWYINRQNEKVHLNFFIGKVEDQTDGTTIRQIVIGPVMFNWGWKE